MKKYNIKTTDVELLKKWYYLMTLGRALDEKAPAYLLQSLGWSFHAPYAGHDGIQLAIGQVFTKGEDFLFPYYRDMLTALSAGMTAEELILNGISKATDPGSGGRHMSNHFAKPEWHIENISSATGTHDLHAAGVARAMVYYDHKGVVITSHGESASSIVRKQSGGIMTAKPAATPEIQRTAPASGTFSAEGVEVKEMDRVRKVIADHMVMSKHTSPHVTNVVEVDVTKLVKWRDKNKDAFFRREGVKLTYMPAITEAVAKALAAYPQVNVSVEGYNILFKKHINIGIAVSLNDGNLIVPVVRDADRLNLNGLAVAIDSLALKARDNKLMPDDISGGTFTITNFGTFKSLFGTPIINQPQVAILGVGYIEKKPAVIETPEGDVIAIRHKMYLSLSYDHRVVDGSLGGNFLYFIKEYLENWKE